MTHLTFESFDLVEDLLATLKEIGFTVPSQIQQEVIPHIMMGRDLIGQAQTGTGKTGAFGLPSLHFLHQNPGSQMLVLTPTRELAKQVSDELYRFGQKLGIKSAIICGGKSFKGQIEALQKGVRVFVATPGRLLDLLTAGQLNHFQPSIVVLDEADEMLDMGFLDDISQIFAHLPKKRQTLMFSATMPNSIKQLAEKILNHPLFIKAKQQETVNQDIEQFCYLIREEERDHAMIRLIDYENPHKAIIFCRTKKDVDRLTHFLVTSGHVARGLHGDMEQPMREEVIRHFRSEHLRFLVATDVAARGLNISNISHVFNYHLPFDPHNYVHRIGRTGRAGNKGIASTFLTLNEWRNFQRFEKILGTKIKQKNIPTLDEVKKIKRVSLAQKIMEQSLHEDSKEMLDLLSAEPKEIASKLVSFLLSQFMVIGPDRIGLEDQGSQGSHHHPSKGRNLSSKKFKDHFRKPSSPRQKQKKWPEKENQFKHKRKA